MYHFVYKTTNLINNKSYIGKHSSNSLDDGYLGSGIIIIRAVCKYGKENFKREIIEICNTLEEAYIREAEIIKELDAVNSDMFYNVTEGGKGNVGFVPVFTEEHRRKISQSLTGKKLTEEHKRNVSLACKGRDVWNKGKKGVQPKSAETRDKISKIMKEIFNDPVTGAAIRMKISRKGRISPMRGKKYGKEVGRKISEKLKGRIISDEAKAKISSKLNGVKKEVVKCPHCDKYGGIGVMKRWHFDNCKSK